jgi:Ca2+-transporting ATPase
VPIKNPPIANPPDDTTQGLSQVEAARRLHADGPNALSPPKRKTLLSTAWELFQDPMLLLLLAAGAIYLLLGDRGEALMLLGFVAVTVIISVSEERRTERVLEALRDLTSPRALVLRDGQSCRIAGTEVVRGDLLVLAEGDRVAADATLLLANDLQTDESLLSGESMPVSKGVAPAGVAAKGDDTTCVFAGSMVVGGQGLARVTATGVNSEIGRIGKSLREIDIPETPLHQQTRHMVRVFSTVGLTLSLVVTVLFGLVRGDWIAGVLAGISLAMSLLPQEFLLILTVFMAMGARRLSKQRVLARRNATIETLGSATVLCTDKTGTLTVNKMAVAKLATLQWQDTGAHWTQWEESATPLGNDTRELLKCAILASEQTPFDTMERALHALGIEKLPLVEQMPVHWQLVHEYGLTPVLPAMTHVWKLDATHQLVAIKGAPESVAGLCHLPAPALQAVTAQALGMATRGLRVLGVAQASWGGGAWPASPDAPGGFEFHFLGLVAFADPLRAEVPAAVAQCRAAGIRVVMITGDHPATALSIATQAGLANQDGGKPLEATTGNQLDAMDEDQLRQCLQTQHVFSRIKPHQKLRIVEALKTDGQVVAMTGDGVNDATALKAAHIGIAMGKRGTDVAREAASLVLLDDNFDAIVGAVRLGRRIYDNLRKALTFVLAVHVPIAGLSILPLLMGWPVILSPVHIAFLELLISPVCSVVFEAEEEESQLMQRPPRKPSEPLFSRPLMVLSLSQGVLVLLAVAALYVWQVGRGVALDEVRALTFVALVSCNLALILANRSLFGSMVQGWLRPNALLWWVLGGTLALLAAAIWIPPVRELFRFGLPPSAQLLYAMGVGLGVLFALEGLKRIRRMASSPAHNWAS